MTNWIRQSFASLSRVISRQSTESHLSARPGHGRPPFRGEVQRERIEMPSDNRRRRRWLFLLLDRPQWRPCRETPRSIVAAVWLVFRVHGEIGRNRFSASASCRSDTYHTSMYTLVAVCDDGCRARYHADPFHSREKSGIPRRHRSDTWPKSVVVVVTSVVDAVVPSLVVVPPQQVSSTTNRGPDIYGI